MKESKLPEKEYGIPKIITEFIKFDEKPITHIVDDGEYVYALVDSHDGYIQVYDFEGNYQKTISFYNSSISGAFSISVVSNTLYVEDCNHNIYIFESGYFQEFVPYIKVTEQIEKITRSEYSGSFRLRHGSIWRFDLQNPVCIVHRSAYAIYHQYHINDLILWIFLIITAVVIIPRLKTGDGLREP